MTESKKYCRSLHAQISLGTTSDDRIMPNGYVKVFANMTDLVLTEKLDGQNNCLSKRGVFARSHVSTTEHPWDKPMRQRWELIKNDLGELEIFGENMYGIHSIGYKNLESYFYVFAVREGDKWLSWEEVRFYASMLDFPTVPEIPIKVKLKDIYIPEQDENRLLEDWLQQNLGMTWEESVETPGLLGGYNPESGVDCSEGFVIRNVDGFKTNDADIDVASNESNNVFKLVRQSHVQTDIHWTKNWKAATLIDYDKYKWSEFEYMSKK